MSRSHRSCRCDRRPPARTTQRGAAAVEFALVASLLFALMIGTLELGRLSYYWVTAAEITRLGARIAVVCDVGEANVKQRMVQRLSMLTTADITVSYAPAGCTAATCLSATVSIAPKSVQTFIPFVPLSVAMPPFETTLPRESMQSTFGGVPNPTCQ